RGRDERVRPGRAGGLRVGQHAGRGHVDDPGEDGDAAGDGLHDGPQGHVALPVGEEGDLAAGPQGEQPVHPTAHEVLDVPGERDGVDLARRVQGGADGRDDAAQRLGRGHGSSPGLASGGSGERAAARRPDRRAAARRDYGAVTVNVVSPKECWRPRTVYWAVAFTLPAVAPAGTVTGIFMLAPWPGLRAGTSTSGALQPDGRVSETFPPGRVTSFWLTTRTVTVVV